MKRVRVWNELISKDNLEKAIIQVAKTHKFAKGHIPIKISWDMLNNVEKYAKHLKYILLIGYKPSRPRVFRHYDKSAEKWREINEPPIFPDQCVQHALIQALEPVMMRGMDKHCCASIKGRGTHYGIRFIKKWLKKKESKNKYVAEIDIRHCYANIQPRFVVARFKKLLKDYQTLDLIERVVEQGVLIGYYTSQWFANVYLQELDNIVRGSRNTSHYLRYIDNFTIFSSRKRRLHKVVKLVSSWLENHRMEMKDNWQIFPSEKRLVNALGYRYGYGFTIMRKRNKRRLAKTLNLFYSLRRKRASIMPWLAQGLISRLGILIHCDGYRLHKRLIKKGTYRQLKKVVREDSKRRNAIWNTFSALKTA